MSVISRPSAKYTCSQPELYAICRIIAESYLANQTDFLEVNDNYTVIFGTDLLAEIEAAKVLPDFQQRDEPSETLHNQLIAAGSAAIFQWKILRSNIRKSFPAVDYKAKVEAAGSEYLDTATNRDWEDLELLISNGQTFITANTAALNAGGMPATFPANYLAAKTNYDTIYGQFKAAEQTGKEGTDEKIIANNTIYDKTLELCEDGQLIYEDNAAKRERFIFAKVKDLVTPGGGGGGGNNNSLTLSGVISDNVTGNPIANAQFTVGPHTFTSDANGNFTKTFTIDEPTTYPVSIVAEGYEDEDTTYQFTPGVDLTQNVQMTPAVGTISGSLKDAGTLMGLPMGTVTLTKPGVVITLTADAMGNYNGAGIPVGTYNATASAPDHISQSVSVTINANSNTVQDFNLVVVP